MNVTRFTKKWDIAFTYTKGWITIRFKNQCERYVYTYWEINSAKIYAIKFLFKQGVPGDQKSKRCFSHVEKKNDTSNQKLQGRVTFAQKFSPLIWACSLRCPRLRKTKRFWHAISPHNGFNLFKNVCERSWRWSIAPVDC